MCEQCCAEVEEIGSPFPDWILVRATVDGMYMKKGDYGLATINDPEFVWSERPTADPGFGLDNEEFVEGEEGWFNVALSATKNLKCDPITGHRLVESAKKAGYNQANDGVFRIWLWHKLGETVDKHNVLQRIAEV